MAQMLGYGFFWIKLSTTNKQRSTLNLIKNIIQNKENKDKKNFKFDNIHKKYLRV